MLACFRISNLKGVIWGLCAKRKESPLLQLLLLNHIRYHSLFRGLKSELLPLILRNQKRYIRPLFSSECEFEPPSNCA